MKFLIVLCATIACVLAYDPSGWKPSGPRLALPNEYGPPQDARTTSNVEITTEYYNPTTVADNTLQVQGLPSQEAAQTFGRLRQQQNVRRPNPKFGQIKQNPLFVQKPFLLSPQFAPAKSGQLINNNRQQVFGRLEQGQPAQFPAQLEYGPPATDNDSDEEPQPELNINEQPEAEIVTGEENNDENEQEAAIAVANANNGQYYILLPDNTLQRVMFATSQTEDDQRANGFTAQLRYSPVEPIKDPVFGYNEQGQLIRLYKK